MTTTATVISTTTAAAEPLASTSTPLLSSPRTDASSCLKRTAQEVRLPAIEAPPIKRSKQNAMYYDIFGTAAKLEIAINRQALSHRKERILYTKDFHQILLWLLGDTCPPKWATIKHKPLCHKIIVIQIDFLDVSFIQALRKYHETQQQIQTQTKFPFFRSSDYCPLQLDIPKFSKHSKYPSFKKLSVVDTKRIKGLEKSFSLFFNNKNNNKNGKQTLQEKRCSHYLNKTKNTQNNSGNGNTNDDNDIKNADTEPTVPAQPTPAQKENTNDNNNDNTNQASAPASTKCAAATESTPQAPAHTSAMMTTATTAQNASRALLAQSRQQLRPASVYNSYHKNQANTNTTTNTSAAMRNLNLFDCRTQSMFGNKYRYPPEYFLPTLDDLRVNGFPLYSGDVHGNHNHDHNNNNDDQKQNHDHFLQFSHTGTTASHAPRTMNGDTHPGSNEDIDVLLADRGGRAETSTECEEETSSTDSTSTSASATTETDDPAYPQGNSRENNPENNPDARAAVPNGDQIEDMVALDCEMVVTTQGIELARVSIVSEDGRLLYDSFVKPENAITDYCTKYSGITPAILANVSKKLSDVQAEVCRFIDGERTVICGHGLENDFMALQMVHTKVLDTSLLFFHNSYKPKLRTLARKFLKRSIQQSEHGHNSSEDALAALDLVKLKLRYGRKYGTVAHQFCSIFTILKNFQRKSCLYGPPELFAPISIATPVSMVPCVSDYEAMQKAQPQLRGLQSDSDNESKEDADLLWLYLTNGEQCGKPDGNGVVDEATVKRYYEHLMRVYETATDNSVVIVASGRKEFSLLNGLRRSHAQAAQAGNREQSNRLSLKIRECELDSKRYPFWMFVRHRNT